MLKKYTIKFISNVHLENVKSMFVIILHDWGINNKQPCLTHYVTKHQPFGIFGWFYGFRLVLT